MSSATGPESDLTLNAAHTAAIEAIDREAHGAWVEAVERAPLEYSSGSNLRSSAAAPERGTKPDHTAHATTHHHIPHTLRPSAPHAPAPVPQPPLPLQPPPAPPVAARAEKRKRARSVRSPDRGHGEACRRHGGRCEAAATRGADIARIRAVRAVACCAAYRITC
jgi:hypothetical protein